MNRETKRDFLYGLRTISVGWGAAFGKLTSEADIYVRGIEKLGNHRSNPDQEDIIQLMVSSIKDFEREDLKKPENWRSVSWAWEHQRNRALERFFLTGIAFSDDHGSSLHREFLPKEKALKYQYNLIKATEIKGLCLTIPEQYEIALNITEGHPLDASTVAFIGSRTIGRNHDKRVSSNGRGNFDYDNNDMDKWLKSIAYFDISPKFDPLGDTYHWWTCCTMGMLLKAHSDQQPKKTEAFNFLFNHGAEVMVLLRKWVAQRPLNYVHKEVDRQGLYVGWKVADHFL